MKIPPSRLLWLVPAVALAFAGCATPPRPADETAVTKSSPAAPKLDQDLGDRVLALDPGHLNGDDVRTLAQGPAPRIILLHGGIYPVHLLMKSFGRFLTGMGYPENQIRDPGDREWSYSPYQDS